MALTYVDEVYRVILLTVCVVNAVRVTPYALDHHVLWNPESMTDSKMSTVDSFNAKRKHIRDNHSSRNPESMADFHKSSTVESGEKKHNQSRSPINMKPGK